MEPKFLANWPQPLRWILVLPASVLAYVLTAVITRLVVGFGTATVLAFGPFGEWEIMRYAMVILDEASVSIAAFGCVILSVTWLAPKFKWPIALIVGVALMGLVTFSAVMSLAGFTTRGYPAFIMILINAIVMVCLFWLLKEIKQEIASTNSGE